MTAPQSVLLPYCGKPHRISDGAPVAHRCRILPADAIEAALEGQFEKAIHTMARAAAAGPLLTHAGIWKLRRR